MEIHTITKEKLFKLNEIFDDLHRNEPSSFFETLKTLYCSDVNDLLDDRIEELVLSEAQYKFFKKLTNNLSLKNYKENLKMIKSSDDKNDTIVPLLLKKSRIEDVVIEQKDVKLLNLYLDGDSIDEFKPLLDEWQIAKIQNVSI